MRQVVIKEVLVSVVLPLLFIQINELGFREIIQIKIIICTLCTLGSMQTTRFPPPILHHDGTNGNKKWRETFYSQVEEMEYFAESAE